VGTHRGELFGAAPTNKPVTVQGILISRIANGKIVEEVESYDALGMLRQIGSIQGAELQRRRRTKIAPGPAAHRRSFSF